MLEQLYLDRRNPFGRAGVSVQLAPPALPMVPKK
jgi:hypothetical protein